ncbi:hypothetical protein D0U02_34195 [Burkholderia pseudomallei]|nr:hypothetical protein D0U05_30385 [Burkholderia pseudomallei]RFS52384.1 hypothetical protein D0U02_34195 [Burkholderia pseudomallei]RFS60024.1 hypothetical protein D0U01_25025 [Burkholderia pseudomallei]RFS69456.1 hypothetical protein D0T98_29135 [Burkholderia pseudomallei]
MRHRPRIRLAGARPTRPTRPTRSTRSTRSTRPGAIGRRAARTRQQSTVNSQQPIFDPPHIRFAPRRSALDVHQEIRGVRMQSCSDAADARRVFRWSER